jgi:hypothetical protein
MMNIDTQTRRLMLGQFGFYLLSISNQNNPTPPLTTGSNSSSNFSNGGIVPTHSINRYRYIHNQL